MMPSDRVKSVLSKFDPQDSPSFGRIRDWQRPKRVNRVGSRRLRSRLLSREGRVLHKLFERIAQIEADLDPPAICSSRHAVPVQIGA
jgi:hypothetical protein